VKKANQKDTTPLSSPVSPTGLEAAKEVFENSSGGDRGSDPAPGGHARGSFSIMTPQNRIPMRTEHVHMRGLGHSWPRCGAGSFRRRYRPLPGKDQTAVFEVAQKAVEEDGAEVIILGCAGMAGYAPELETKLNIKVLDPTAIALKVARPWRTRARPQQARHVCVSPEKVFK